MNIAELEQIVEVLVNKYAYVVKRHAGHSIELKNSSLEVGEHVIMFDINRPNVDDYYIGQLKNEVDAVRKKKLIEDAVNAELDIIFNN